MERDLERLQGAWAITTLELDGEAVPGALLANARVVIEGDRFTSSGMGAEYSGTLVLDSTARPRRLDMKFDAGPEKGNSNLCIYELAGAKLNLCIATRGTTRPASFAAPRGSGFAFERLVRAKEGTAAAAAPKRAKGRTPPPTDSSPPTEFEGEWQMVSGVMDGKPMDAATVQWVKRVTRGHQTTVYAGPQVMLEFNFTFDATQSPKTIDYTLAASVNKGKKQLGINELKGRELRILTSAPGAARPLGFQSAPGRGDTLTVWSRGK